MAQRVHLLCAAAIVSAHSAQDPVAGGAVDDFGGRPGLLKVFQGGWRALLLADDDIERSAGIQAVLRLVEEAVDQGLSGANRGIGDDSVKGARYSGVAVSLYHLGLYTVELQVAP